MTETNSPRFGYHFGGFAEIPIGNRLSINPELLYSSIGFVFEYSENARPNLENPGMSDMYLKSTQRFNYLAIPLGFSFHFDRNLNLQIGP
ncbi:outer membrane beta-barrel protein [Pricia mediterranea]|uniref:outer membrane beta-barrel protein n=1 Tax=Pricia mediterranea TaxID=3076079 RepID=UPI003D77B9CF